MNSIIGGSVYPMSTWRKILKLAGWLLFLFFVVIWAFIMYTLLARTPWLNNIFGFQIVTPRPPRPLPDLPVPGVDFPTIVPSLETGEGVTGTSGS